MGRLTIADVESLRANAEPLSTAVAAYASANSYKSANVRGKPQAQSLSHHFSVESKNFSGSMLKKTANQIIKHPVIPLGTGRPSADFYPWDAVTFHGGSTYPYTPHSANGGGIGVPKVSTVAMRGGTYDLSRGLNYGHAVGSQPLVRFVTEHVEIVHDPPYRDWAVALTCGSTAALEIASRIFCKRGDSVLTERYTYPGMIEVAQLLGSHALGIEMDAGGLKPDHMEDILRGWDESQGPRPAVLYPIPSGQNPTGATQSPERKNAIYQVAEKYDLIIVEDDPYYFLRIDLNPSSLGKPVNCNQGDRDEVIAYLANLTPSFLTLDRSGRVVRLDSVSKILAPGLRAGWVTASEEIIDKFIAYHEVSTVAVSGVTQLMLWNLLDDTWGHVGFFAWLDHLSLQYCARLDILLQVCDKHLPKSFCKWVPPQNGMFLWISLDLQQHPAFRSAEKKIVDLPDFGIQNQEIEARIFSAALKNGVQITQGSLFDTNKSSCGSLHLRLTYAAAAETGFEEGVRKLAQVLSEEFALETNF